MAKIRSLEDGDRDTWERLWRAYLDFYEADISADVTEATWKRLLDSGTPMFCLVAENDAGSVVGFTHCVIHLNTWTAHPICYLEDLFVDPAYRKAGVGRQLIEAVGEKAKAENWGRLYWMTKQDNQTARALYDKIARFSGFIRYDYPLS